MIFTKRNPSNGRLFESANGAVSTLGRRFSAPIASALAVATLALGAGQAYAGTFIDMTLVSWSAHAASGPTVNLYNTSNSLVASDALTYGGAFLWNAVPVSGPAPTVNDFVDPVPSNAGIDFLTFCLELNQTIGWGQTYRAEVIPLAQAPSSGAPPGSNPAGMGADSAKWISQLWAKYYPTLPITSSASTSTLAGAFQLAIWKLEYDPELMAGGLSMSEFQSGYLRISQSDITAYTNNTQTGIIDLAFKWINDILTNGGPQAQLVALSGSFQDQVVQLDRPNIQQTPIPEPGSLVIWFVAAAVMTLPRLRRRSIESARG